jgi:hypothetical protein
MLVVVCKTAVMRYAYRDIVRRLRVRGNRNQDADYAEEGVDERPPGKVGIRLLDIANHRRDESDQPRELRHYC